ncbi:MAG: anaerobic ribonucleoside triphosphate reductase [Alphaproteobacteria bacterium ADurb.Bin438]|nr:MAG: anaerobic ribonucleoside triphosphate reductase [Alphaproteobacteria bacterium ADurb.Bin438]
MNKTIILDNAERTRCEIWTRVMGYHRPVSEFNKGKKSEYKERTFYKESNACRTLKKYQVA